MKAERRHELQENSLARMIENLPVAARLYADKILLGVILVLLVIVLIRWRINAREQRMEGAVDSLALARSAIRQVTNTLPIGPADQIAQIRAQARADAERNIEQAINDARSNDDTLRAEALVARGDLYWTLANLPPLPGASSSPATTQSSLITTFTPAASETPEELLNKSRQSYEQVLSSYPGQARAKAASLFGLAGIAENRGDWDAAAKAYQAVIDDKGILKMYQSLAQRRLKMLDEIKQPKLLAAPSTRPAEPDLPSLIMPPPATRSAATAPTPPPAVQPSTQPTR
jgi:tetratricopeptide (TPR) repeat protein